MIDKEEKWKKIHNLQATGEAPLAMGKDEFMSILSSVEIDTEIAEEVVSRLEEPGMESNVIFIFTENDYVVTAIHVPADSIDGEDGPVIMPGAGEKSIIAAFSRESIIRKLEKIKEPAPGLPLLADQHWVEELEKMAEAVKIEIQANPPARWDDLLKGNG